MVFLLSFYVNYYCQNNYTENKSFVIGYVLIVYGLRGSFRITLIGCVSLLLQSSHQKSMTSRTPGMTAMSSASRSFSIN
jgi:hypothetical protein